MSAQWKPGDAEVAIVSWQSASKRFSGTNLAFRVSDDYDESHWRTQNFGDIADDRVTDVRPLVVIDPEDAEQVDRLYDAIEAAQEPVPYNAGTDALNESLASALREYASPTPPKPEEPQGLGAVVEDADGHRWVHVPGVGGPNGANWVDALSKEIPWSDIAAVRVLSEGVTP